VLETALLSLGIALLTSVLVNFALSWQMRIRIARLEMQLSEYEERLAREMKQRAAAASVAVRQGKLNPIDEAMMRKALAHQGTVEDDVDPPWWEKLVR